MDPLLYAQEHYERESENDFLLFLRGLRIPSAAGPRMFEDCMLEYERRGVEPFQRRFFEDLAPSVESLLIGGIPSIRRFWMERTKKAGKDSDLAVVILWLMAFARRPFLCQVVAADRDQAAIVKRRAEAVIFYNDWLQRYVRVQANKIIGLDGLGVTRIEATDNAGSHGETPDLLILNELVHVAKWEVMETHYNNAAGVPRGMMIVSTNAGFKGTKAEKWKENALSDEKRWRVHLWKKMSPWLNEDDVKDAKKVNTPSEYARLFDPGIWISGKGDALTEEGINGCFRRSLHPLTKPEEGWIYVAGLDLGISHDHAGLVVLGVNREEQRVRVASIHDWIPSVPNNEGQLEVNISDVEDACVAVYGLFRVVWFGYDPAAGGSFSAQRLRTRSVRMVKVAFTGKSLDQMATAFMQIVGAGKLECFEDERMRRDLGKFHIVRKLPEGYRLVAVSDEHGHADVGTALVICLPRVLEMIGGIATDVGHFFAEKVKDEEFDEKELMEMDPFLRGIVEEEQEFQEEERCDRMLKKTSRDLGKFL